MAMEGDQKAAISIRLGKTNEKKPDNPEQAEITVKQFLDFLKTAYQVHENLEGILLAEGMTDVVDWIKLKDSAIVKPSSSEQKSSSDVKKAISELDPLHNKLNDVLNEGIMDSVLPYLVPQNMLKKISTTKTSEKPTTQAQGSGSTPSIPKRKSSITSIKVTKTDSEVEIHVCDEIKGIRKDFVCNQKLLVEQMGYFADVTKEQKLDDMDISVHCDIAIFEWLMRWVKMDGVLEEDKPVLEAKNAIPVLVSASFLQMEPLLQECLYFCHRNMNDILKTNASLSCINDAILTRLAAMYTNAEVEALRDRKDRIQSRLFCKLIQSLCEVEPESMRGHYCSLAKVYRCKCCQQLVHPVYSINIPCIPSCMSLQFDGSVTNEHVRDPSWDLNEYILSLHKLTKSWRKVYWKLWGCCHFLYCLCCKRYFSVKQEGWCRYHPDHPQFFTLDAQKPPLPVGRYPCCGERAYRFQLLDDRNGCFFREHTPSAKEVKDASIVAMLESYRNLIVEEPPKLIFPDRLTRLVAREPTDADEGKLESKEVLWWEGLEIVPPRPKFGLLGMFNERNPIESEDEEETNNSQSSEEDSSTSSSSDASSSNSPASEESVNLKKKKAVKRKVVKKKINRNDLKLWQHNLSARSNQDLQRTYEESTFKQMSTMLNSRMLVEDSGSKTNTKATKHGVPPGGIWVRLESEWREKNIPVTKNKNIYTGKVRMKTTRLL